MLWQLYIENVAIIEKLSVEFSPGFVVFTGETGAGKSILIDSIGAVLGERTNRELVRRGAERALVTAAFSGLPENAVRKLEELGYPPEEDAVMLSREISADGRSVCRIDGRPATVGVVRQLAPMLLQIHGQHDTVQLMTEAAQGEIIDRYGGLSQEVSGFREQYRRLTAVSRELERLRTDEAEKARTTELLRYQIDEIEGAELEEGEEEELHDRRERIRNRVKIASALNAALECLSGGDEEAGAVDLLSDAVGSLREISRFNESYETLRAQLEEACYTVEEAAVSLRDLSEEENDSGELDEIESRLDLIYQLERKYGRTVADVLAFAQDARVRLEQIVTSGERQVQLLREQEALRAKLSERAAFLHEQRLAAAERFARSVKENLTFLDMPQVRFEVRCDRVPLGENGIDKLQFLISTNPGEEPKPVSRIASGGELSRIMLAMKNVQADSDEVGTLIFDEIDTGVSGRAAQKIGQTLVSAARNRQVLCVTHLAQMAALAAQHLYLYKEVVGDRTYTRIRALDRAGRVEELSRILGGEHITELVRQNADEMLRLAGN